METILIVDDEKNYLLVLEALLVDAGYEVITSDSTTEALEITMSHDLDLVITDMRMPGGISRPITESAARPAGNYDDSIRHSGKGCGGYEAGRFRLHHQAF